MCAQVSDLSTDTVVTADEFARLMAPLGPFEKNPLIAVAVSGGIDSMALLCLSMDWAKARGGRVVALTVDHGLRQSALMEATQVKKWAEKLGAECHLLRWQGIKPKTGIQQQARRARYDLLYQSCRDNGILHLLLAHTRDDQAETFLLRQSRLSGVDGLAAMANITAQKYCQVLRPLLSVEKNRLRATLTDCKQGWIEDPSNQDKRFQRVRIRKKMAENPDRSFGLAEQCLNYRARRIENEKKAARFAGRRVSLWPSGFARVDRDMLKTADRDCAGRVLAQLIRTVGGADYAPSPLSVKGVYEAVVSDGTTRRTLGRSRIDVKKKAVVIGREQRNVPGLENITTLSPIHWDNRFRIAFSTHLSPQQRDKMKTWMGEGALTVAALGMDGWKNLQQQCPDINTMTMPRAHLLTLPAVFLKGKIIACGGLYVNARDKDSVNAAIEIVFSPPEPFMTISQ